MAATGGAQAIPSDCLVNDCHEIWTYNAGTRRYSWYQPAGLELSDMPNRYDGYLSAVLEVDDGRARLGWAQPPVRRIAVMGTRPYSCEVQWGIFDNAIYRASQELYRLSPQQTVHLIRFRVFVQ